VIELGNVRWVEEMRAKAVAERERRASAQRRKQGEEQDKYHSFEKIMSVTTVRAKEDSFVYLIGSGK
jgi:hypothetical protein